MMPVPPFRLSLSSEVFPFSSLSLFRSKPRFIISFLRFFIWSNIKKKKPLSNHFFSIKKPQPPKRIINPLKYCVVGFFASQIAMTDSQNPEDSRSRKAGVSRLIKLNRFHWWLLVICNVVFLIAGQTAAVLLGRFYYDKGGSSTFMATLVQTAAFPVLLIPLLLLPSRSPPQEPPPSPSNPPKMKYICAVYVVLGILIAGDNLLYSVGLLYLSASTYSLICTTQLVFNVLFSYFLNGQRLTALILNSVVIVTFSAALLAVNQDSDVPSGVSKLHYTIGFLSTLGASALYSLLLSLMQLSFQKVIKKTTFRVVLEMQIWTSLVATLVSVSGLFISGQWKSIGDEMVGFQTGKASYVMTLAWTAVCWQVCSVGVVGLIFLVSSLFSNVISTVALAVAPIAAVIVFRDKMNGVKIIAMIQAFWGLGSYTYQEYLDESAKDGSQDAGRSSGDV